MRVYFAASLFTQAERVWNRALADAIKSVLPAASILLPQDFDAKGKHDAVAAYGSIFAACVREIDNADVVLAVIDGTDPDSGTSWEMGYAYAKGKPSSVCEPISAQGPSTGSISCSPALAGIR